MEEQLKTILVTDRLTLYEGEIIFQNTYRLKEILIIRLLYLQIN